MKKIFAGGAALALAGAGSVALAGTVGAQDTDLEGTDQLSASISAATVAAGESVTVTSDDSCTVEEGYSMAYLAVDIYPAGAFETTGGPVSDEEVAHLVVDEGILYSDSFLNLFEGTEYYDEYVAEASGFSGDVSSDGSWSVSFTAPEASGSYEFFAFCGGQIEDRYFDDFDADLEVPAEEEEAEEEEADDVEEEVEGELDEVEGELENLEAGDIEDDVDIDLPEDEVEDVEDEVDEVVDEIDDVVGDDGELEMPEEYDVIDDSNEGYVVPFSVTGGDAAAATPVGGTPSFTG